MESRDPITPANMLLHTNETSTLMSINLLINRDVTEQYAPMAATCHIEGVPKGSEGPLPTKKAFWDALDLSIFLTLLRPGSDT
jgi:hypothetical protein